MSPRKRSRSEVRETTSEYGAPVRVSATEAARGFSDLLNRVLYRGESFVIERAGAAVGELRPVAPVRCTGSDWLALMRSLPEIDEEFGAAVEEAVRSQGSAPGASPWES